MLKGEILSCPMCKTEYLLPTEGVYVFPKDATRRNLIEFFFFTPFFGTVKTKVLPFMTRLITF
jgi:hypothetical protein